MSGTQESSVGRYCVWNVANVRSEAQTCGAKRDHCHQGNMLTHRRYITDILVLVDSALPRGVFATVSHESQYMPRYHRDHSICISITWMTMYASVSHGSQCMPRHQVQVTPHQNSCESLGTIAQCSLRTVLALPPMEGKL